MATRSRYRPPGPDIDGWPPGPFKLAKLADSRSAYSNLLSEVKSKVSILEASEKYRRFAPLRGLCLDSELYLWLRRLMQARSLDAEALIDRLADATSI